MSVYSLFTNAENSNSTNSSLISISDVISDDWKTMAQQFLYDGNGTAVIDYFCNAWVGDGSSPNIAANTGVAPHVAIWNHAMTKTIGWTMVMLLKTMLLEQKFDSWSGAYRFLNLGSTLVPFAMAMWSICTAINEAGEGEANKEESVSKTDAILILGKHLATTPAVQTWVLTGFAWSLFHRLAFRRIRSSKTISKIEWIPGLLFGFLSLSCWVVGETTVAAALLGGEGDLHPNTLLIYGKLLQWMSNAITGWYCYAWMLNTVFDTRRFSSFPWFLLVVLAGRTALLGVPL